MSLQYRLIVVIVSLILSLLVANVLLTVSNAREKLFEQLDIHAQDTATLLGFTISQLEQPVDKVQLETMINALFDGGYYLRIHYNDLASNTTIGREHEELLIANVPAWFIEWMPLAEPRGRAQVSSGWYQVGNVDVIGHPGLAYQDLWRTFKGQVLLFLAAACICIGFSILVLHYLLRPLRAVQAQADGICRREFHIQDVLPKVPEFRVLAETMNRMVAKIKSMFQEQIQLNEQLHNQLHTDALTQLNNRDYFDRRLAAYLRKDKDSGSVLVAIVTLANLDSINRHYSRDLGDEAIKQIADLLRSAVSEHARSELGRHRGADFALFIPSLAIDEAKEWLSSTAEKIDHLQLDEYPVEIHMGAAYASQAHVQEALMSLADNALAQAIEQGVTYRWVEYDSETPVFAANQWRELILSALKQRSLAFQYQPVWQLDGDQQSLLFHEVTSTLVAAGHFQSASVFMPVATRLGLAALVDDVVIDMLSMNESDDVFCVNISTASLEQPQFIHSLSERFEAHPSLAKRLVFELNASSLAIAEKAVREFAAFIKNAGSQLSLHHFGQGAADFAYLQSLPVDFLKIDRFFIQSITHNDDHLFFVRSLIAIAKSCDIMVLAEGVESQEQWTKLIALGIDGGQGFYLGKPQADLTA